MEKISLGISSCLLGRQVRFDGGHRWERWLTATWGPWVDLVPVCPEVECGLGVPRDPMRLVGDPAAPRLLTVRTRQDHTQTLLAWVQPRLRELEQEDLCGFIFKSNSPSCGPAGVKVYPETGRGTPAPRGVGLFARAFLEHFPLLPAAAEDRLPDPGFRENFLERLFVCRRWRQLLARKAGPGELVAFHTRHKLQVLAHSPAHYRLLGQLVARVKDHPLQEVYGQYQTLLMAALRLQATPRKHTNVLQHILGYFKKELPANEKQELLELIVSYHRGDVPLLVPLTLLNHYGRQYRQPYLQEQFYLHPHPLEMRLRNQA